MTTSLFCLRVVPVAGMLTACVLLGACSINPPDLNRIGSTGGYKLAEIHSLIEKHLVEVNHIPADATFNWSPMIQVIVLADRTQDMYFSVEVQSSLKPSTKVTGQFANDEKKNVYITTSLD